MDESYQIYLNRVARLTLPATYQSQVQHIQESPKFKPDLAGVRQAVPFPGYTLITPPWGEESENSSFYGHLKVCQEQLLQQLGTGFFIPVPPDSFHLTLADLIWDSAYKHAISNPDFEQKLQSRISEILTQYQQTITGGNPIRWQLLGLMLMPRALAVCFIPKDEASYQRISEFRRVIYQDLDLIGLGIEQQYHFTAHVTLGYFGEIPADLNRDDFCKALSTLNYQWVENEPPELQTKRAELRKFDDMTRYYRQPDWPVLEF